MKRRRSYRLAVKADALASLAAAWNGDHDKLVGRGFVLGGNSGVWRGKHGLLTARFVYRHVADDGSSSIVFTFRERG